MARLGMVIDLSRCVGCGACAFACKAENNTRTRSEDQSFNWADFVMPVLCNHCSDAPCIKVCPGNPEKAGKGNPYKALYKTPEGITMHDPELCVGCGDCQKRCPYSHPKLDASSLDGGSYSVISLNAAQDDPDSRISQTLKKEKSFRLKEEAGTRPNVHYIGKYSARA